MLDRVGCCNSHRICYETTQTREASNCSGMLLSKHRDCYICCIDNIHWWGSTESFTRTSILWLCRSVICLHISHYFLEVGLDEGTEEWKALHCYNDIVWNSRRRGVSREEREPCRYRRWWRRVSRKRRGRCINQCPANYRGIHSSVAVNLIRTRRGRAQ